MGESKGLGDGGGGADGRVRPALPLRRVLVADDHPAVRELIIRILAAPGVVFEEAGDGEAALAAYDRFHPDLVLMDIAMPGLDGFRAAHSIRSRHPGAQILIVTQYDSDAMRAEAARAGALGLIPKSELVSLPSCVAAVLAEPAAGGPGSGRIDPNKPQE